MVNGSVRTLRPLVRTALRTHEAQDVAMPPDRRPHPVHSDSLADQATQPSRRGGLALGRQAVDVLDDLTAHTVGVGDLRADLREADTGQDLRRADVVLCDTGEERSRRLDLQERLERPGAEAVAPSRRVDPVGHLALTVHAEAPDGPDEGAAVVDRPQQAVGIVSDLLVVTRSE